jgi:serine/threonine-protein kinase
VEQDELPQTLVIPIAVQMCDLLSYLHQCDPPVVHRDFTPENLLFTDDHQVKLIDFNVAHRLESASTKTVAGKHAYISPEQFRGKPTAQSDIYSLGASLYFILMKKDPEPISKSVPDCDARLAKIVAHCTEPVESDRYVTVAQVKTDLQALPAATTAGM